MNLVFAFEQRFLRTPDGKFWSTALYPRSFWSRYLRVFDRMSIIARVHDVPRPLDSWKRVDGDGVSLVPVPPYVGPWQYLRSFRRVHNAIGRADLGTAALILQVPGLIASLVLSVIESGQPYGIEVVGDPYDVFSPQAFSHPLRPLFRSWFTRRLKRECRQAACSIYVTERALQARYPPTPGRFSTWASDLDLGDEALVASAGAIRDRSRPGKPFRLIFVGTLEVLYKSPDVLVRAFAEAMQQGLDGELVLIGDGREKPKIEAMAGQLGVGNYVKFLGQLPSGQAVRDRLDESDLFILPSRQEGMPRALIEAMARGLPCISTPVGGIPELLPPAALVPPNDVKALAAKILLLASDSRFRSKMAEQNLERARRYHQNILQPRRIPFLERLVVVTEEWQKSRKRTV